VNESEFEAGLRAAFQPPPESASLDAKIDAALSRYRRTRRLRHLVPACACAALVGLTVWAAPPLEAQAAVSRMVHALAAVDTYTATTYYADDAGRLVPYARTAYSHGNWRIDGPGAGLELYVGGKCYVLDRYLGAYILDPHPNMFEGRRPAISTSEIVAQSAGAAWGRRVSVERATLNGRSVSRVSVRSLERAERVVYDTDPATDLPIEERHEVLEAGGRQIRSVSKCSYGSAVDPKLFELDLHRFSVVTPKQVDRLLTARIERNSLGSVPLRAGRLVVRSFDVSEDGTVYVLYQAGALPSGSSLRNALELTADDGTDYARPFSPEVPRMQFVPADGIPEVEVFVPLVPQRPGVRRTYTLTTHRYTDRSPARLSVTRSGDRGPLSFVALPRDEMTEPPGAPSPSAHGETAVVSRVTAVTLLQKTIAGPTCASYPPVLCEFDATGNFENELAAEAMKAGLRAYRYEQWERWQDALRLYQEELRLQHKLEAMGGAGETGETLLNIRRMRQQLKRGR